MKHNNICIMGIPEGEDSERGRQLKNLFEKIMTEKFPSLVGKKTKTKPDTQVQEAQRVPNKRDAKSHNKTHYN